MLTFGQIPSPGDVPYESGVSDDRRALTLTFSKGADAEVWNLSRPTATRQFSVVLPLEGSAAGEVRVALQAGLEMTERTTAAVLLSANGQSTVADFVGKTSQTLVLSLSIPADAMTECRVVALLVAGRDSAIDLSAYLNLISLDAEILASTRQANRQAD